MATFDKSGYVRQRQGRDFPALAVEAGEVAEMTRKLEEVKRSFAQQLEYFKEQAERGVVVRDNAAHGGAGLDDAPTDGHEPPPERAAYAKGRC